MQTHKKGKQCNILLADDGSEHAQAAVSFLGDLPLPAGTVITVLSVFSSTRATEWALLKQAVNQTCTLLKKQGLQAKPELLFGSPAEKIIDYTDQHRPDLIVVGAKGLRATPGILLGGVAQQMVEYALCPVLVVRAPFTSLKRVLLVTDGSPSSDQALHFLGKFPLPNSVSLQVMHVLPPPPMPIMVPGPSFVAPQVVEPLPLSQEELALMKQQEKDGQALLDCTIEVLQARGIASNGVLKQGDAATEIIEYVKKQEIDLVVTGSRGFSRIKSWLLGSVSRKLVHYSGCSVLVVRGPQTG